MLRNSRRRASLWGRCNRSHSFFRSEIPAHTRVWIGRSALNGLHADGTDVGLNGPDGATKIATGNASTFIVGHLALQVFAVHPLPEHKDKSPDSVFDSVQPGPGPWNNLLVQIWPAHTRIVTWPPPQTFTGTGTRYHIGQLLYRWRIRKRATQPIS